MDGSDRIRNSSRNMFYGLIKYIVLFIFPFIMRTTIIYSFGVEYAGIGSLFSSILQVLNLSELGFSTVVIYAMYEPVAKNDIDRICKLLSFYRKIYLVIGSFILGAGILICPFVQHFINGQYPTEININVIFLFLLINTASSYLICGYKSTIFVVYQRDDMSSKMQLAANLCMYTLQFASLFVLKNYYAYTISMLIGTLINNFLIYRYTNKMFPDLQCRGKLDAQESKILLKKVSTLFGHQFDVVIITSADSIVISSFLGLKTLTMYGNYYTIVSALLGMLIMIANSFLASIGNSIAIETTEKNYDSFLKFTYFIINVTGICSILMFILYQDFMTIWMGTELLLDDKIVFLMCFSFFVRLWKRPGNMYKEARGLWDKDMLKPYVAGLTNLILNIFLVKYIGLYGVIVSTIVSIWLIEKPWETYVLFHYYFKDGLGLYIRKQALSIVKILAIGSISYLIMAKFSAVSIPMFLIKAVISGILVIGLFTLISLKDKEFKYIISSFKKVVKAKQA